MIRPARARHAPAHAKPGALRLRPAAALTASVLAVPVLLYASTTLARPPVQLALEVPADPSSLSALSGSDLGVASPDENTRPTPFPGRTPVATTGPGRLVRLAGPVSGLPAEVAGAYVHAAAEETRAAPGCHLTWPLLAGIGQVESGHASGHGAGVPGWSGTATPSIVGPVLDGTDYPAVADTDSGRLDGDLRHDRAVGPMQFLPSTWQRWGVDANRDGVADPQNLADAARAAADYLCADGHDLDRPQAVVTAIFSYNHSVDYVRSVLTAAVGYSPGPSVLAVALAGLPAPVSSSPSPSPDPVQAVPIRPVDRSGASPVRSPLPPTAAPRTDPPRTPGGPGSPTATPSGDPGPTTTADPTPSTTQEAPSTVSPTPTEAPAGQ